MFLLFILLGAVCTDLYSFRIPNWLILSGFISGIGCQLIWPGTQLLYENIAAAFLTIVFLIPLFRLRVIGGGDVKLFGVCALFTGFPRIGYIILYAFLAGGILSIFYLAYRRVISKNNRHKKTVIHFSIPIFIGAAAEYLWGGIIWHMF
jgi:prepilin peptidase CpaA